MLRDINLLIELVFIKLVVLSSNHHSEKKSILQVQLLILI